MKKLLLILLCVPLMFSCGEDNTGNTEKEEKKEENTLDREITQEMRDDGYTGKGTWNFGAHQITGYGGIKYIGEWKDGKMHGKGTFTLPDGEKYVGEWKDGKRNGHGTFTNPDGQKYVGEYKDGKRNGQGTMTYTDGTVKKGLWENGEFIGKETK